MKGYKSITISDQDYKKLEEASKLWNTSIPKLMPKIISDELRCAKEEKRIKTAYN